MKFEDYYIDGLLKKSLGELDFRRPTDIQFKAIPSILKKEDVLAIAQTGTGKTAAFVIPTLHLLLKNKATSIGPRCIIMVPTHELARQIAGVIMQIGKHTKIKTLALHGGVEQAPQIAQLKRGIDILVATPGRLFDLVSQKYLTLRSVEILILDEADQMLDLGFIKDIKDLIKILPRRRQTLFFSATINEQIKKLAYSLISQSAIRIQISPKDPVSKNIDHFVVFIAINDKRFFLERLIKEHPESKILVFVRTKVRAERILNALSRMEISSMALHGDKSQQERQQALKQFNSGQNKILIATDVSARGIDIPAVDYVVNYDLPEQPETYVHRVGRTGRGTRRGHAVSFCSPEEKPLLETIETFLGKPISILEIDKSDYQQTIDFSQDTAGDLKSLLKEIEELENTHKKKKGKKK